MLGWLKRRVINHEVKKEVKKLSNDHKATALGAVLAGLQLANVDYVKLSQGDKIEAGKTAGAVVTALLGYFINKGEPKAQGEDDASQDGK